VTNRNGGMLRLNASRRDDDDDETLAHGRAGQRLISGVIMISAN